MFNMSVTYDPFRASLRKRKHKLLTLLRATDHLKLYLDMNDLTL